MNYKSPKDIEDRKTRKWERNRIFQYNKELHSNRKKKNKEDKK